MRVGRIVAVILWSLGGIVVSYVGLFIVLFFLGLDPIHDLWTTSVGLLYAEFIGGGLLLILSGSWVNRKSTESLQSKKASKST